jgi:ubiquinone/menaquinone biosynthesis C-methylase UbiE
MRDHRVARFCLAIAIVIALAAAAAQPGHAQQAQRTPEEYAKFLEGAERVARMQVPRVVEALGVRPGLTVADIGSGSGLFTRPLAKAAAPGLVYAVDIDQALLDIVARSAQEAGLSNVRTVRGAAGDPRLSSPVDLIFVCDALHHIANQGEYLKRLRKHLAPGGRIAVIDFSERWPDGHESMRYSAVQFERWMAEAGFTRATSFDWLENSFFALYR